MKEKAFATLYIVRLVDVWNSHFANCKHSMKKKGHKELTENPLELGNRF